jgi:hypothetical protein
MQISFEAYTVWGLVQGRVEADQPLHDVLVENDTLAVYHCRITPLAPGPLGERASAVVNVDDLLVVVAPPDTPAPVHASWNELTLSVGPFEVAGLLPTLPGFDPGRSLARPSSRLVLLSDVSIGLLNQPGFVLGKHAFAWVNRYDVDRVVSELELPFHFPGAQREAPVPPALAPPVTTSASANS